jgi:predicted choloylglycine hydrolase
VPKNEKDKIERRLKAVEDEVRKHVEEIWRKTKPEVIDRANALVTTFEKTLAKIESDIAAALAKGDQKKADELTASQAKTQELLAAAKSSASELK